MKCQMKTSAIFPAAINGIRVHNGPIPSSLARTGDIAATVAPEERPPVIAEVTSSRFTTEPVTSGEPRDAVAA